MSVYVLAPHDSSRCSPKTNRALVETGRQFPSFQSWAARSIRITSQRTGPESVELFFFAHAIISTSTRQLPTHEYNSSSSASLFFPSKAFPCCRPTRARLPIERVPHDPRPARHHRQRVTMRGLLRLLPLLPAAIAYPGPVPTAAEPNAVPTATTPAVVARAEPTVAPTPAAPAVAIAPRVEPTAIWVGVNKDGSPTATVTPHQTIIDGRLTLVDAPPYELTGTVFTWVEQMRQTTSTGSRRPAPTGKGKTGAFPKCFKAGEESPFCEPVRDGSIMRVGKNYYSPSLLTPSLPHPIPSFSYNESRQPRYAYNGPNC